MSKLNLIIRGTRREAEKAAKARGIPFSFIRETDRQEVAPGLRALYPFETIGTTDDNHAGAVKAWFKETPTGRRDYESGTLMEWSEQTQVRPKRISD